MEITLKEKLKSNSENNLENYKKLLKVLKKSCIRNKTQTIINCEYAIKKQEQILQNIERW